jgi:hypothetical protein
VPFSPPSAIPPPVRWITPLTKDAPVTP